jgi:hypothetical protein
VNTITVAGELFLLVGGGKAHLAAEANNAESARPAVSSWRFDEGEKWQDSYDLDQLGEPRWNQRTLCGWDWQEMEPGDGPGLLPWGTHVHAPDCRSCLRIVSRNFESQPGDERIPLVVGLAMQEVLEFGSSRVDGVPGDQAEALRTAFRAELRRRKLRGRTYLRETTLFVVSEDAWSALPQDRSSALNQEISVALNWLSEHDTAPARRGVDWSIWDIS